MNKKLDPLILLDELLNSWTSTPIGRREFLASIPLILSATSCATKLTSDRKREGDNSGQETSLTVEDEKKMTQEALKEMRKDYPAVNDPNLQNYINSLGQKMVRLNGLNNNPYQYNFTVVDVPYVNAFALPAGTVMITAPLLAMAETEAELAGVVGHEIGHIQARHTAERIHKAQQEQKKSTVLGAIGGIAGAAAGFGLGKALCKPKDNECLQKATLYGAAAGVGGALLVQKYKFMANSREDEMEADRISFRTGVRSGYSKDHVGLFYEKLLELEKSSKKGQGNSLLASLADAMSTHPPSQERVNQIKQLARDENPNSQSIISTNDFAFMRARAQKLKKS
jgi:predicted Zn-dependent protease